MRSSPVPSMSSTEVLTNAMPSPPLTGLSPTAAMMAATAAQAVAPGGAAAEAGQQDALPMNEPDTSNTLGKDKVNDAPIYRSNEFRINCYKVLACSRRTPHDWKSCPFVHPGEHGRRRPLAVLRYEATMCPFIRRGEACPMGDACTKAHNVFEMWLHPDRYRTQICIQGPACTRKVCFFAHTPEELRRPPKPASSGNRRGGGAFGPGFAGAAVAPASPNGAACWSIPAGSVLSNAAWEEALAAANGSAASALLLPQGPVDGTTLHRVGSMPLGSGSPPLANGFASDGGDGGSAASVQSLIDLQQTAGLQQALILEASAAAAARGDGGGACDAPAVTAGFPAANSLRVALPPVPPGGYGSPSSAATPAAGGAVRLISAASAPPGTIFDGAYDGFEFVASSGLVAGLRSAGATPTALPLMSAAAPIAGGGGGGSPPTASVGGGGYSAAAGGAWPPPAFNLAAPVTAEMVVGPLFCSQLPSAPIPQSAVLNGGGWMAGASPSSGC